TKGQYLLGKNNQQIYGKLQRWLGSQNISQFNKIRLDLDEVKAWRKHHAMSYKKNRKGTNVKSWEENAKLFGKTEQEVERVRIPYVRRFENPLHRKQALKEVEQNPDLIDRDFYLELKREDEKWEEERKLKLIK